MRIYKTSEWVSLGHPDKVADYISEYILDRLIEQDPETRYALEVQIKGNHVSLAGEVTTKAKINYEDEVRNAVKEIGYTKIYQERFGKENTICSDDIKVSAHISMQSPDIAKGVDKEGWGDQGIFFGYYCDETPTGHGLDYSLARQIGKNLYLFALVQEELGLDIKTQVTISSENGKDHEVEEVIVAIPMAPGKEKQATKIVKNVIKSFEQCKDANIIINGTGTYCKHGPIADSGTTGRKLVVDFHGGRSRIGGGSPWTKDGTKADLTLNIFAHELAKEYFENLNGVGAILHHVETELSCCIGRQEVLCQIYAYGHEGTLLYVSSDMIKLSTKSLIEKYGLNKPIFAKICRDGITFAFQPIKHTKKNQ